VFDERLELCVGGCAEIVAATAHESGHPSATTCSNSPVDTSQLLSQEAGEANLLHAMRARLYIALLILAPSFANHRTQPEVSPSGSSIKVIFAELL
jgi:hypothetical protein